MPHIGLGSSFSLPPAMSSITPEVLIPIGNDVFVPFDLMRPKLTARYRMAIRVWNFASEPRLFSATPPHSIM